MILPAENKMNVEEDLTPEQLENFTVHYVKTIDEALRFSSASGGGGSGGEDTLDAAEGSQAGLQSDGAGEGTGSGSRQGADTSLRVCETFKGQPRARLAFSLCAEHVRQLGGESPLPNLVEVKG